jgi:hypothetical protein
MVITYLFVMLAMIGYSQAKDWRSIVPLHSTRADVEQLLGKPETDRPHGSRYDLEGGRLWISYNTKPCEGPSGGWNVSPNTVISIWFSYSDPQPKFAELKLDKSKYKKVLEGDYLDFVTYRNDDGIAYEVNEPKGLVNSVRYSPTAKDDHHLRCPAPPQNSDDGMENSRKFDNYSNISLDEENRRLDNFATQLQVDEPEAKGYIIAYAGRQARKGEAQARADHVKDYLVRMRELDPARIMTIDGGHREKMTVELWIRPNGWRAPKASPTVDPSKVQIIKAGSAKNNKRRSTRPHRH